MSNRLAILVEIKREVLIQAGHRCSVCGESTPLENAHIFPYSKSKDNCADNLICLCSNCHTRADKEKWGAKTLREYKRYPHVLRIHGFYKDITLKSKTRKLDSPIVANFATSLVKNLPHPIATVCDAFNNAENEKDQFNKIDMLINNIVKYLTAIALSLYWQNKPDKKQLRKWLEMLDQSHLITSLGIFAEINEFYKTTNKDQYLPHVIFDNYDIEVDDESAISKCYELIRKHQGKGRNKEDITPKTFLYQLLAFREKEWESNINMVDKKVIDQFLQVLRLSLEQIISNYKSLFEYPLYFIERIDREDKNSNNGVYTLIGYPGPDGKPTINEEDHYIEKGVELPTITKTRRLYLCDKNNKNKPILNLHPFLIEFLHELYFFEQTNSDEKLWYQHCASVKQYQPPSRYMSLFLWRSDQDDEKLDTVDKLNEAVDELENESKSRHFDNASFGILNCNIADDGRKALEIALGEAIRIGRFWVGVEFMIMALSKQRGNIFIKLLQAIGISSGSFRGVLRGMVGVVGNQDWRKLDVEAIGSKNFPKLEECIPDQLRDDLKQEDRQSLIITPRLMHILRDAVKNAQGRKIGHKEILLSLLNDNHSVAVQLFYSTAYDAGWKPEKVLSRLIEMCEIKRENPAPNEDNIEEKRDEAKEKDIPFTPDKDKLEPDINYDKKAHQGTVLDKFGRNLTELAKNGELNPIEGESARKAMAQIAQILLQREANNPILIGDPGVGKTALVEGLAQRLAGAGEKQVIPQLQNRQIIELPVNAIMTDTKYRGDLEKRLQQLLAVVISGKREFVIFIDEIHSILSGPDSGSLKEISDTIKPALSRGEFPCIGATTVAEYRRHIEKDAALARRFSPVWLDEPSIDEAIEIVEKVAMNHLAKHHNVSITKEAVETAVKMSVRYILDERLPGKAIKVLDKACAGTIIPGTLSGHENKNISNNYTVSVDSVLKVIAERIHIPVEQLKLSDKQRYLCLEDNLKKRIFGQDEAVSMISSVVKRAGAGLSDTKRPLSVFLFAGPTGVGKTELSLALTEALFGNEEAIFRLDMSEFMEKHQIARLTGAPPGYIGYESEGQLTGRLRQRPYSVVLFDEIEKAHKDIQHLFLQLFDNGRITDAKGRVADGRNAVFIMTTNLGAKEALNFISDRKYQEKINNAISNHFSMEFLNRIDRIVIFEPLQAKGFTQIFDRELLPYQDRLKEEHKLTLTVEEKAKHRLIESVSYQLHGARPLKRLIEDQIINHVVDKLLSGEIEPGSSLEFKIGDLKI